MNSARRQNPTARSRNGRMGSCRSQRQGVVLVDEDGNEKLLRNPSSIDDCLTRISNHKAKSSKEEALTTMVRLLTMEVRKDFVEKNFATLLYNCLFYVKKSKGSAKELMLALQIIGLLVMIVTYEDDAHEIFQDSVSQLAPVLDSGSEKKSKILECLGIVTFFGSKRNAGEAEDVMLMIWKFIVSVAVKKRSADLATGISVWSFLLSGVGAWNLNQKDWQGCVSLLLSILEDDDFEDHVHVIAAASEALVLITEIDFICKFYAEAKGKTVGDIKQILKDKVTEKLRFQAMRLSQDNKGTFDVLEFLKKTYAKTGKDEVLLSKWRDRIQLNFLKKFLGEEGFVRHARLNENFVQVFEFIPKEKKKKATSKMVASPEREEIKLRFFQGKVERKKDGNDVNLLPLVGKQAKEMNDRIKGRSGNSSLKKAMTCLRNKQRMLSAEEKSHLHDDFYYD